MPYPHADEVLSGLAGGDGGRRDMQRADLTIHGHSRAPERTRCASGRRRS